MKRLTWFLGLVVINFSVWAADDVFHDSFESAQLNWQIEYKDGAQGICELDKTLGCSGKNSLRLTKTNSVGYIILRSATPVKLSLGRNYSYVGFFHADSAPLSSLLLFRLGGEKTENFPNPYGLYHFVAEGHIPNSPAGQWEKRIVNYNCANDANPDANIARNVPETVYPYLILYGNPATVWLDDIQIREARSSNRTDRGKYIFKYDQQDVYRILSERRDTHIELKETGGQMKIFRDGRPIPPSIYFATENNELVGDYASFGQAGFNLAGVPLSLGFNVGADATWLGKDRYDFAKVDECLLKVLRKNPYADLVIQFHITPYREWGEENPNECWRDEAGRVAYDYWAPYLPGGFGKIRDFAENLAAIPPYPGRPQAKPCLLPSYHSLKWQQDSCAAIKAIVEHIKNSPFGKAVVGFQLMGGWDGRWQLGLTDYSPCTSTRFQEWCRNRYGSPDKLAQAWGQPLADFSQIKLPAKAVAAVYGQVTKETPYSVDRQRNDYLFFRRGDVWVLADAYAHAAKAALGKPSFATVYRHQEEEFFQTKHLDINGNDFAFYAYRRPGWAPNWLCPRSVQHHKMIFVDMDLRTWAGPQIVDEEYEQLIGAALTPAAWVATHRKLVGMALVRQGGYWYWDMLAYFQDPFIIENIAKINLQVQKIVALPPRQFQPNVAVIISGDTDHRDNFPVYYSVYHNVAKVNDEQGMMLLTAGVPYDIYYLNDFLQLKEATRYKVCVFLHDLYITQEQRRQLEKFKGGGRTLVWVYDTGYISEKGKDADAMAELLGMNIKTEETFARLTPLLTATESPLTKNALPFQGMSELTYCNFRLHGADSGYAPAQPFWIEDAAATPLATYRENGRIAMAVKKYPKWTSIYLAAPNSLGNDLFHNIAQDAGAFVAGPPGQLVEMNGNFISIHGLRTENYEFNLPAGARRLIDVDRDRVIAEDKKSVTLKIECQKTTWYTLE